VVVKWWFCCIGRDHHLPVIENRGQGQMPMQKCVCYTSIYYSVVLQIFIDGVVELGFYSNVISSFSCQLTEHGGLVGLRPAAMVQSSTCGHVNVVCVAIRPTLIIHWFISIIWVKQVTLAGLKCHKVDELPCNSS